MEERNIAASSECSGEGFQRRQRMTGHGVTAVWWGWTRNSCDALLSRIVILICRSAALRNAPLIKLGVARRQAGKDTPESCSICREDGDCETNTRVTSCVTGPQELPLLILLLNGKETRREINNLK